MIRDSHLRDLIAVVETGSIRGAARRLGISEAAVSKNLTALERSIGVALLVRSAHGAEPTQQGRVVLRRARAIGAERQRLEEEVAAMQGETAGSISVGLSSTAEAMLLSRAFGRFHSQAPDIRIGTTSGPPAAMLPALREGRLDFVIGPAPAALMGPDLQAERLISTDMVVVCRPGHPLRKRMSMAALAACEWVVGVRQSEVEAALAQALVAEGLPEPRCPVQRDSFNAMLHLVAHSDMLAAASRPTVEPFCAAGMLGMLDVPLALPPMLQWLVTVGARPLPKPAELLAAEFRRASRAYRR